MTGIISQGSKGYAESPSSTPWSRWLAKARPIRLILMILESCVAPGQRATALMIWYWWLHTSCTLMLCLLFLFTYCGSWGPNLQAYSCTCVQSTMPVTFRNPAIPKKPSSVSCTCSAVVGNLMYCQDERICTLNL